MNKSIKDEFSNLISDQTPDLWDRIEAALPEKNVVKEENKAKNRKKYKKYTAYGTVAAAACLCIIIFASKQNFMKSEEFVETVTDKNSSNSMTETVMEESSEETEYVEETETASGESEKYTAFAEDSAEMAEDVSDMEMTREETGAAFEESSPYANNETAQTSDVLKESLSSEKQEMEKDILEKIETLEDQGYFVFEDISVRIECILETTYEEHAIFTYQVTVLQEDGYMEKGTQLLLKADELLKDNLVEGESYRITFYDNKLPIDSSIHEYFLLKAEK